MVTQGSLTSVRGRTLGFVALSGCLLGAMATAPAACSDAPNPSAPDAAFTPPQEAGADVDAGADAMNPVLPYPPGPYGAGIGDVLPDFHVQGYGLSRDMRESRQAAYRDVALSEVRSDPACTCLVVVWNAVGSGCQPCAEADSTLAAAIAKDRTMCAIEVLGSSLDTIGMGPGPVAQPPTRADLDVFTQAGREPFPVGIVTSSAFDGLVAGSFTGVPIHLVVRPSDMRVAGIVYGSGLNLNPGLPARARGLCDAPSAPVQKVMDGVSPRQLALDGADAYITDANRGILRAPLAGGAPTVFASPMAKPDALLVDDANVYWASHDGSGIHEVAQLPKTGGAPLVLTSGAAGYLGIANDPTTVYFTRSDGVIGSVPIGGGPVTTLAAGEPAPTFIAVDATKVYWTASGTAEIASVPKSGGMRAAVLPPGGLPAGVAPGELHVAGTRLLFGLSNGKFSGVGGIPLVGGSVYFAFGTGNVASFAVVSPSLVLLAAGNSVDNRSSFSIGSAVISGAASDLDNSLAVSTPGQHIVSAIAGDTEYTYWTVNIPDVAANGGAVRRIRR